MLSGLTVAIETDTTKGQVIIQGHYAKLQILDATHLKARFQEGALEEAGLVFLHKAGNNNLKTVYTIRDV